MLDKEIIALLRLSQVPGLGPVRSRKLIALAGSPTAIFSDESLLRHHGIGARWCAEFRREDYLRRAEAQYGKCRQQGVTCIPITGPQYPGNLLHCPDAPLLLFQKGKVPDRDRPVLAVVGTRKMTAAGRAFCRALIRGLMPYKPSIISGFAYGVDICAQAAAMDLGLQTVACMAHGLDLVYPAAHRAYVPRLLENGGMLSECWLGQSPRPELFLRRNRIIAGLSVATVVIESAEKGGSLVTADLAFGYDREVFAVPGKPGDPMSAGCNALISQQKAQLLRSAEDLAQALGWEPVEKAGKCTSFEVPDHWPEEARRLFGILREKGAVHADTIAREIGIPIPDVLSLLLRMEMKGIVGHSGGNTYSLTI